MAKADKKSFMEGLAEEAEEAARKQDLKTLYRITKTLSGGLKNSDVPVKDTNGNLISSKTGKLECWKEHFQTILNRPEPTETTQIPEAEEDMDVNTDQPTLEEVKMAIKVMKNGKSPGSDGVTAEMLKVEDTVTPRLLTDLQRHLGNRKHTRGLENGADLCRRLISNCNNWRGITLLSLTSSL